jgi:hypothetical protein
VLPCLKELEALEKVGEGIDSLTICGGLNGVFHGLAKLRSEAG